MTAPAETNEDQNPLTKPKFIISAVVVAIIVALGIVLALLPKGSGNAEPAPAPSSTTTASGQPGPSAGASFCGLPDGDQSKPATEPANTKWELIGKVAAPTSPTKYGPGKTDPNGLRSCFAHSPTGALYAAVNVTALSSAGKARLVFENLAFPGPERDTLLQQPEPSETYTQTAQLAGFAFRSYNGDRAVADLAFKGSNGTYLSIPVPLQWDSGDWKFLVPATGSTGARQIADLSGYIPWAGV
ncbi:hypothetical protein [Pseudarthrobacter sp. S9]|uniref:hypothetical protein n=1 Tax=Pseudarthrobacter sp. S9 TaxID=3418421 RepID=UPI003D0780DD